VELDTEHCREQRMPDADVPSGETLSSTDNTSEDQRFTLTVFPAVASRGSSRGPQEDSAATPATLGATLGT
jgi:hypothetical protein